MKTNLAALVAGMALVCALSACGGGGDGGTAPTVAKQPTPAPTKTVLIEEYGDSTTHGLQIFNGVASVTPNSEPAVLQQLLQQQFGAAVTVSNEGVDGAEAAQLLNGTDKKHAPWDQQMAASKADIVTLNFMRNDSFYNSVPQAGLPQESPEEYGRILTQLVQVARAHGKQVVLYEPNPVAFPEGNVAMLAYLDQLKKVVVAQQVPVVFNWEYSQGLADYPSLLSDGVHPVDALYRYNAEWAAQVVAPMVQSLLR
ncbi:SGNH/GDSL hydrolase family protein [Burkholderia vietnamiensis]|uniref:SGNH/GDSL hydrolase family protein n=1 Tax=Burkholderia vietnamiensis TaxID=60552 RepID=UPI001CF19C06|nr:SGNH/GDSL hydrolase family protein [Burkholderia vietnamiensis]MCA8264786.1 SGNH/GDSL hydrolase family protein [Burkholderia vietnamiensis]